MDSEDKKVHKGWIIEYYYKGMFSYEKYFSRKYFGLTYVEREAQQYSQHDRYEAKIFIAYGVEK